MSGTPRPWWLLINKPAGLVTTIEDRSRPDERVFVIRGEPVVQGLAWLTCGPVAALLAIAVLTALAIAISAQTQPGTVRLLFVAAFLGFPALAWGLAVIIANRVSSRYVQAIRAAETQTCVIRLNQKTGKLTCNPPDEAEPIELSFEQIEHVHVTPALGARDSKSVVLALETSRGSVILLNEKLGNHAQKADVAQAIEAARQTYAQSLGNNSG